MKLEAFAGLAILASGFSGAVQAAEVGGWTISQLDESCIMAMEYEGKGETELFFYYNADGSNLFIIGNNGWTPKIGESYTLHIDIDDVSFSGIEATAIESGGVKRLGFRIAPESDFERKFRNGSGLRLSMGDTLVDDLSLKGTDAAGAATQRCAQRLSRRFDAEAKERARFDHIPDDPFAKKSETSERPEGMAKPASSPRGVPTNGDYPSSAERADEEGTVRVRLTVSSNGDVTECAVVGSSGSSALDTTTCRIFVSRTRYSPAVDTGGKKIESQVNTAVRWSIPQQAPSTE